MAAVTYFQRYSSKENTVTNNTLQLFARIHDYSAHAFANLINQVAGTADDDRQIEIGPSITQQNRSGSSVPDARIEQRSFCLLVETKTSAGLDTGQLIRHIERFPDGTMKILVSISKNRPNCKEEKNLKKAIRKKAPDVIFSAIDFCQLCDWIEALFEPHEREMRVITDDYRDYCREEGILDRSEEVMRIVPCGDSHELNTKYGIYYHPSDRGYTPHAYVGIYVNKCVISLWRIRSVFDAELTDDGRLRKTHVKGEDTSKYDKKVERIMEEAKSHCGHRIFTGHRFFCGEPFSTEFKKTSKYGIQRNRYCNLARELGEDGSIDLDSPRKVAAALSGREWQ